MQTPDWSGAVHHVTLFTTCFERRASQALQADDRFQFFEFNHRGFLPVHTCRVLNLAVFTGNAYRLKTFVSRQPNSLRGVWRLSAKCEPNYTHRPLSPFGRLKDARRRDGEHGNSLRALQWGQGRTQTADIAGRLSKFKSLCHSRYLFSLFCQPKKN